MQSSDPTRPGPVAVRSARLPRGDHLVIRTAGADDVDELLRLFERLSPEDRQRRFFSMFRPDRPFVERMVTLPDRGGLLLVAELHPVDPALETHVVGEAGYAPLDDGDAELDITVDRSARGWLAPYLLDALAEQAAVRGVRNLRAEILLGNRPMLALVRARGCATLDSEDHSVVETTIGTGGEPPSWPPRRHGPRVLVEVPGARWRATPGLREAGIDVIACGGPAARCGAHGCPMLSGEPCPLVEGADVVVFSLRQTDERARALLDAHRQMGTHPLVIEVRDGEHTVDAPEDAVELQRPDVEELRDVITGLLAPSRSTQLEAVSQSDP